MFHGVDFGTSASAKVKPHRNLEKDVLFHKNETIVTARVEKIAGELFQRTLKLAGKSPSKSHILSASCKTARTQAHLKNPNKIHWVKSSETAPNFYTSVLIDNVKYNVSDKVLIEMSCSYCYSLEILLQ